MYIYISLIGETIKKKMSMNNSSQRKKQKFNLWLFPLWSFWPKVASLDGHFFHCEGHADEGNLKIFYLEGPIHFV